MDHFERELARMMRDTREHTPFEAEHRARLRSGVRARRRARTVQKAAGSVLAVAGLGLGFFMLPRDPGENRPQAPLPRPATSPTSPGPDATRTPNVSPSGTSTASPTGTAGEPSAPATTPTTAGSSATVSSDPTATATETEQPPSGTGTPSAPTTPSSTPTVEASDMTASVDSG